MKTLTQRLTAVLIATSMAGVVQANGNGDHGRTCSEATLQGLYVFSATGFSIVGGVAQPRAVVEFIRFDGQGGLSVPGGTLSVNGVITQGIGGPGPAGSYSVEPNWKPQFHVGSSPRWTCDSGVGTGRLAIFG